MIPGTAPRTAVALVALLFALTTIAAPALAQQSAGDDEEPGVVDCANLVYGDNRTSVCFSDDFLAQIQKETNIRTSRRFTPVKLESQELYLFPFAVMTGEDDFMLTELQRENLRNYLLNGGFVIASAGCSSRAWDRSFRREIAGLFPELELTELEPEHPVFHTVYDIERLRTKRVGVTPRLEGLEIDGKIVLIYSAEGLNDTANAGGDCCCCGGNEILNAREMNVNLLAYALTH